MQLYEKHINTETIENIKETKLLLNNNFEQNEFINNRGFHNDIVYYIDINTNDNICKKKVVGIKQRMNKYFVGILHLESKIKYGNSKYLFKPLLKYFPDFYVTSNKKKKSKNVRKNRI